MDKEALKNEIIEMIRTVHDPEIPVNIYEVAPVNGLAAPDGRIFLTRGMYEAFRQNRISAEELASVIAHELGHVALGHTRKRMIDFTGQNAVRMVLMGVLGRFLPGIRVLPAHATLGGCVEEISSRSEEQQGKQDQSRAVHRRTSLFAVVWMRRCRLRVDRADLDDGPSPVNLSIPVDVGPGRNRTRAVAEQSLDRYVAGPDWKLLWGSVGRR